MLEKDENNRITLNEIMVVSFIIQKHDWVTKYGEYPMKIEEMEMIRVTNAEKRIAISTIMPIEQIERASRRERV